MSGVSPVKAAPSAAVLTRPQQRGALILLTALVVWVLLAS